MFDFRLLSLIRLIFTLMPLPLFYFLLMFFMPLRAIKILRAYAYDVATLDIDIDGCQPYATATGHAV